MKFWSLLTGDFIGFFAQRDLERSLEDSQKRARRARSASSLKDGRIAALTEKVRFQERELDELRGRLVEAGLMDEAEREARREESSRLASGLVLGSVRKLMVPEVEGWHSGLAKGVPTAGEEEISATQDFRFR